MLKLNSLQSKKKGEAFPLNLGGKIMSTIRIITDLKPTESRKRKKERYKNCKEKGKTLFAGDIIYLEKYKRVN